MSSELKEILEQHLKKRLKLLEQQNSKRKTFVPFVPDSGDSSQDEPDGEPNDGWILKRSVPPTWREKNMFDFCFENPLDGKFKELPQIAQLVKDYPNFVRKSPTSYCHYGFDYRKRTVFISSLINFNPIPPCPGNSCKWNGNHPRTALDCSSEQKNSIPQPLINLIIDSWIKRHSSGVKAFLLLDVFSGWGSIVAAAKSFKSATILTYSNDHCKRGVNTTSATLDMTKFSLVDLLSYALIFHFPAEIHQIFAHSGNVVGFCNENRIAVLFFCSTPCETYSVVGLKSHREGSSLNAKSQLARSHDAMNALLVRWLKKVVLQPQR